VLSIHWNKLCQRNFGNTFAHCTGLVSSQVMDQFPPWQLANFWFQPLRQVLRLEVTRLWGITYTYVSWAQTFPPLPPAPTPTTSAGCKCVRNCVYLICLACLPPNSMIVATRRRILKGDGGDMLACGLAGLEEMHFEPEMGLRDAWPT